MKSNIVTSDNDAAFTPGELVTTRKGNGFMNVVVLVTGTGNASSTFAGVKLYPAGIGNQGVCQTWAKEAYESFTGEITLSN